MYKMYAYTYIYNKTNTCAPQVTNGEIAST